MDLVGWAKSLPCKLSAMPVMIVRQYGQVEEQYTDFRVRSHYVRALLFWLKRVHPEVYGDLRDDPESEAVFAQLRDLGCEGQGGASVQSGLGAYVLRGRAAASEAGPAQHASFGGATTLDMSSSTVLQAMPHAGPATIVQRSLQLNGELELSQDPALERDVEDERRSNVASTRLELRSAAATAHVLVFVWAGAQAARGR